MKPVHGVHGVPSDGPKWKKNISSDECIKTAFIVGFARKKH